jgi:hypothetical protein
MTARATFLKLTGVATLAINLSLAQPPKTAPAAPPAPVSAPLDQPDAQRTRDQLRNLLDHYPPALRTVLATDPSLLLNQSYLAPYPALASFLTAHPEVAHSPSFYIGSYDRPFQPNTNSTPAERTWDRMLEGLGVFIGFGMAIGVLIWLIRTVIDYRRWNRLTKIQTDVHTKLLDRFTANDELLSYMQSPAGAKFLESAPITLDSGPRAMAAPLGRIMWSAQTGLVLIAGGLGLAAIAAQAADEVSQQFRGLGILAICIGLGFVASAIISYMISRRLGLIEPPPRAHAVESKG